MRHGIGTEDADETLASMANLTSVSKGASCHRRVKTRLYLLEDDVGVVISTSALIVCISDRLRESIH